MIRHSPLPPLARLSVCDRRAVYEQNDEILCAWANKVFIYLFAHDDSLHLGDHGTMERRPLSVRTRRAGEKVRVRSFAFMPNPEIFVLEVK